MRRGDRERTEGNVTKMRARAHTDAQKNERRRSEQEREARQKAQAGKGKAVGREERKQAENRRESVRRQRVRDNGIRDGWCGHSEKCTHGECACMGVRVGCCLLVFGVGGGVAVGGGTRVFTPAIVCCTESV
jgi:hypothetical protein